MARWRSYGTTSRRELESDRDATVDASIEKGLTQEVYRDSYLDNDINFKGGNVSKKGYAQYNSTPLITGTMLAEHQKGGIATFAAQPLCYHTGRKVLFSVELEDGPRNFAPANERGIELFHNDISLVIDCAGIVKQNSDFVNVSAAGDHKAKLSALATLYKNPPVLRLNWTDMNPPPHAVRIDFWRALLHTAPTGLNVVCCIGGHGRTGTCLASLLIACGYTAKDAIDFVRKEHCSKAIETKDQERYLEAMETGFIASGFAPLFVDKKSWTA